MTSPKMYCDPNCKPWNSRNWAPEGFTSRDDMVNHHKAGKADADHIEDAGVEKGAFQNGNTNGNAEKGLTNGNAEKGLTNGNAEKGLTNGHAEEVRDI